MSNLYDQLHYVCRIDGWLTDWLTTLTTLTTLHLPTHKASRLLQSVLPRAFPDLPGLHQNVILKFNSNIGCFLTVIMYTHQPSRFKGQGYFNLWDKIVSCQMQDSTKLFHSIISFNFIWNVPWKCVNFTIWFCNKKSEILFLWQKLFSVRETYFCERNLFLCQKLISVTETYFCDKNIFSWLKLISVTETDFCFGNLFLWQKLISVAET